MGLVSIELKIWNNEFGFATILYQIRFLVKKKKPLKISVF